MTQPCLPLCTPTSSSCFMTPWKSFCSTYQFYSLGMLNFGVGLILYQEDILSSFHSLCLLITCMGIFVECLEARPL